MSSLRQAHALLLAWLCAACCRALVLALHGCHGLGYLNPMKARRAPVVKYVRSPSCWYDVRTSEDRPLSVAPSEARNSAASSLSSSFSSDSTCTAAHLGFGMH